MRTEIPEGPQNKALKLTKGAEVRAPRHYASLHRSSVPRSTFFTNVPSQLNAVFDRLPQGHGDGVDTSRGVEQRRGARYGAHWHAGGSEAEAAPRGPSPAPTACLRLP